MPDTPPLSALPEHLRRLVHVQALLGACDVRRRASLLAALLNAAGLPPSKGSRWHDGAVQAGLNSLKGLGCLDGNGRLRREHDLAREAAARPDRERLRAAFERVFPLPGPEGGNSGKAGSGTLRTSASPPRELRGPLLRRLRLAAYGNDGPDFERLLLRLRQCPAAPSPAPIPGADGGPPDALEDPAGSLLRDVPYDLDWFLSRARPIRSQLFLNALDALAVSGLSNPNLAALLAYARQNPGCVDQPDPAHAGVILRHILCGEFAEAQAGLSSRLRDANDALGPLLQGMTAFFTGDNGAALKALREGVRRCRKLTGRRRALPPHPGSLCLLLALLRDGDVALLDEADALLEGALHPPGPCRRGLAAVHALLLAARGKGGLAAEVLKAPDAAGDAAAEPLADVLVLIAKYRLGRDMPGVWTASDLRRAEACFAARADVLPLEARLLCDVLIPDHPAPEIWLDFREAFPQEVIDLAELGPSRTAWEHDLEQLRRALVPAASAAKAPPKRQRLIWLLNPAWGDIRPVQQSCNAKGEWGTGREAALKRLAEEQENLPWLTEQDRAVLGALRPRSGWNGPSYAFDAPSALTRLAGHPLIFLHEGRRPVSLTAHRAELSILRTGDGYLCRLSGFERDGNVACLDFPRYCLRREAEDRYAVHVPPPELLPAAVVVGPHGLRLPPESAEQVLALIRDRDPALPVRMDIGPAQSLAADAAPIFRLRPLGGGLRVSLAVRPFGADAPHGPVFPPGKGAPEPPGLREGRPVAARRDFSEERRQAFRAVAACPLLRQYAGLEGREGEEQRSGITADAIPAHMDWEWRLETPEEALQCLLELRNCPERPRLEWPDGETLRVVSPTAGTPLQVRMRKAGDWFEARGNLVLDDGRVLDMARLLDALSEAGKHGGPRLIHPLAAPAVQEILDAPDQPDRPGDAARDKENGIALDADTSWRDLLRRVREAEERPAEVPSTLRAELRGYQREGFVWLSRLARSGAGACLADDMGLGKTLQAIAVMLELAPQGPCLVAAPMSVCHNWEQEIVRFAPTLRPRRFGSSRREALVKELEPGDVLIVSYGLLGRLRSALAARRWPMAVFDEAQALKNAATQRAKAGRSIAADFRLALTGTPIENYLEDLRSLFEIINPGLLGPQRTFRQRFGGDAPEARQALKALVRPFLLRRIKSAVLHELPPRTEQTISVELSKEERAFYEALRRRALEHLTAREEDGAGRRMHILAELTRLRRACCHPALVAPETDLSGSKLAAFLEIVEELRRGGHKALVFSQFTGHLALVRRALEAEGRRHQYLDGGTPEVRRRESVAAFQRGEGDLFLISLKAGGQGLNLTAADYVIHLDPWWNPAVEDQATDRAHRMGQRRPVTVYRLVAENTVEEKILALHAEKRALAAEFLEGADTAAAPSEEELLQLLM